MPVPVQPRDLNPAIGPLPIKRDPGDVAPSPGGGPGYPSIPPNPPGTNPLDPPRGGKPGINPPRGFQPIDAAFQNPNFPLGDRSPARMFGEPKDRHDSLFDIFEMFAKWISNTLAGVNVDVTSIDIDNKRPDVIGGREGRMIPLVAIETARKLSIKQQQSLAIEGFARAVAQTPKADGVDIVTSRIIRPTMPDMFQGSIRSAIDRPIRGRRAIAQTVPVEIMGQVESDGDIYVANASSDMANLSANIVTTRDDAGAVARRAQEGPTPQWQNALYLIAAVVIAIMILRKAS